MGLVPPLREPGATMTRPDKEDSHGIERSRARALPLLELPVLGADAGAAASGVYAQGGQASACRADRVNRAKPVRRPASSSTTTTEKGTAMSRGAVKKFTPRRCGPRRPRLKPAATLPHVEDS